MIVCPTIMAASNGRTRQLLESMRGKASLVEVRIDGIPDPDLKAILRPPRPRVIVTNRSAREGGEFTGNAREQIELLRAAVAAGADAVDIEMRLGIGAVERLVREAGRGKIIVSRHDMRRMPPDLEMRFEEMMSTRAGIVKMAVTARDIGDNRRMFDLMAAARRRRRRFIGICMGERGEISRILAGRYGGYLSFASVPAEFPAAPGQIPFDAMKGLYRAERVDRRTRVFGLVGNPVAQSRGRYFHNGVFRRRSAPAVYVNFLVDDVGGFLGKFAGDVSGLSVTMPHKQAIVRYLDFLRGAAKETGVVNTVLRKGGKLTGWNTDYPAILALLKERTPLRNRKVVILGSGATARSMGFAASGAGARVTIAARTPSSARQLSSDLGCDWVPLESAWEAGPEIVMSAAPAGAIRVPARFLRRSMVVFEGAYAPEPTPLVREAVRAGCSTITGEDLFLRQAGLQSKLFFSLMGRA